MRSPSFVVVGSCLTAVAAMVALTCGDVTAQTTARPRKPAATRQAPKARAQKPPQPKVANKPAPPRQLTDDEFVKALDRTPTQAVSVRRLDAGSRKLNTSGWLQARTWSTPQGLRYEVLGSGGSIPVGVWRRWFCATCKHPPHDAPGTRRVFKFLAVVLLGVMSATMWANMPGAEPRLLWPLRVGLPVLTVVTLVWALRHKIEPDVRRALAAISPYRGAMCPVCGEGEFSDSPYWGCRVCGVRHEPLPLKLRAP